MSLEGSVNRVQGLRFGVLAKLDAFFENPADMWLRAGKRPPP